MNRANKPHLVKKYGNRRLYATATSTYITLEDIERMVRAGEEFVVIDAKTEADITGSILTQIILEKESNEHNLFPIALLKQFIRLYDDSLNKLIPPYLEFALSCFLKDKKTFCKVAEEGCLATGESFFQQALDDSLRAHTLFFKKIMEFYSPQNFFEKQKETRVSAQEAREGERKSPKTKTEARSLPPSSEDISSVAPETIVELKKQLEHLQRQVDQLLSKHKRS